MMWLDFAVPLLAKICLVGMFPLSAYDKIAHWDEAMEQASSGPLPAPALLLVVGILVETIMPVLIVIAVWDRAAAFVLAGFCVITALLFHRFWEDPDFWSKNGKGRSHFWDCLKNFGLAGGPEGVPVREQRFDATEVGHSKLCTIVELTPRDGGELSKDEDGVLQAIGLDRDASGLHDVEVWDSIYNPGKVLVLGSWAEASDAAAFPPGAVPGAGTVRSRAVRVIRDYGMFDRRETPQYFSEARPQNQRAPA